MKPTYDELLADNQRLREQLARNQEEVLAELVQQLLDTPLIRVKPEAFEYRIYELEIDYMMQLADSPESKAAWESLEKVRANYFRAYPDRPLNPKPRPSETPSNANGAPMWPTAKPRKPYTRKVKAA
jgi:hypothetical protein